MESYIAIDGCKSGWIAAILSPKKALSCQFIKKDTLRHFISDYKTSEPILIDMPIGLLGTGYKMRCCDRLARRMLGPRKRSSVFPVPTRLSLEEGDYKAGSSKNRELVGKGIPVQSWSLRDKLIEVDDLLSSEPWIKNVLLEFHPELAFACLNNGTPVYTNKKRHTGADDRIGIIQKHIPSLDVKAYYEAHKLPGRFAEDDFLDALAGSVMLMKSKGNLKELPGNNEDCEAGLQTMTQDGVKMRIVYV